MTVPDYTHLRELCDRLPANYDRLILRDALDRLEALEKVREAAEAYATGAAQDSYEQLIERHQKLYQSLAAARSTK